MKIYNPNKLKTIDYRTVQDLQENLKDLSTENHDKLLKVLEKRGFDIPLYIWFDKETPYLCDGHQRVRVMKLNELTDAGNYEVPYIEVEAATKKEAVERVLEIASQYGTTTVDGLDELVAMYELDVEELDINFDSVNVDKLFGEDEPDEPEPKEKVTRYTIDQLKDLRNAFAAEQGMPDNGFVDWLEKRSL